MATALIYNNTLHKNQQRKWVEFRTRILKYFCLFSFCLAYGYCRGFAFAIVKRVAREDEWRNSAPHCRARRVLAGRASNRHLIDTWFRGMEVFNLLWASRAVTGLDLNYLAFSNILLKNHFVFLSLSSSCLVALDSLRSN